MGILNKLKLKKEKKETQTIPSTSSIGGKVNLEKANNIGINQRISQHQSALLIKQAWITEKASDLANLGKYVFIVDKKSNKSEVKKNIESIYKVRVKDVKIINVKGKTKRLGRSLGRTSAYKKVIVTLKEGEKIEIMPT